MSVRVQLFVTFSIRAVSSAAAATSADAAMSTMLCSSVPA